MDNKAALKTHLEKLSPEQRAALLQQIARQREQQRQQMADAASSQPGARGRYALSQAQRRLWTLSQMGDNASAAYNIVSAFCFDEVLQPQQLQRAWRRLLASHEVLRSAFNQDDSGLYQLPRYAGDWEMQARVLRADLDFEAQLQQIARSEAEKAFDLQHDWLLRVFYCVADPEPDSHAGCSGLVIVIHHSVCDGLSITTMVRELAQHYADSRLCDVFEENASPAGLQYRDYVAFEARADHSKAMLYWKSVFASAPDTLDAMLDLARPVFRDFAGSSVAVTLPAPDAEAFEKFCHANNATLYMGLVAAVQLLLARFANVGEVTLGTPVAGRPDARFNNVAGPFVNTIALRQVIDPAQTFTDLLRQVRRRVLEGFQHQGLAFDELVSALGFNKDPGRSPLYDVMLGFTTADDMALSFGGSTGRALRLPLLFSKVDLTFHFEKGSDGSLRLELEYATTVLLEATVQRLCGAWQQLASALPLQPERPVGELALQSEQEQQFLLEQINSTARPYPKHSTLINEFHRCVARYPEAIAVHAGDVQLSYRDLDRQSQQLAQWLMAHPAYKPGRCIALRLEKDERALITILAILKSQCVYLPLAANTPMDRTREVLVTGAAILLIAESRQHQEIEAPGVDVVDIDSALSAARQWPDAALPATAADIMSGNDPTPAYLMFTSGSTGKPKGTLIEQRAVLRLVCNTDYHQVQAGEHVLLTGSLAFDAATFEIWAPLLNGGCVCIPAGTTLLEVHEFHALVDHYQVDTTFLTTGLFNQLVDNNAAAFSRLKTVLTGGEKISVEHVSKLLQNQPTLKLLHVYGPTENTTFSTWHRIHKNDLASATVPIGKPIANSRIYLLDANLQPVPVGVPGEIVCGGDGVALGYVQTPDGAGNSQTDAFMADPFLPSGQGRLYRTGDLAKWNHQYELIFLGRRDRQVKVRGFRVELAEVEYQLRTLPEVMDAYVQARGQSGSSELIAWLVTSTGTGEPVGTIRAALSVTLPAYMLPAKVVYLQRLPLNASGKVDAAALPMPEELVADNTASPRQARPLAGETEQALASLYAAVLGLSGNASVVIERDANFFSLGGDSIRAIQLVSLARSKGYHFTLKDIFASETLAGLAAMVTVSVADAPTAVLTSGPMSPTQHWWLDHCGVPADHFNLSSVFKVAGPIDVTVLRAALEALLELHPALRLSLDINTGQQHIASEGQYLLLEAQPGQSRQHCWQALQQSINLQTGVLLAVGIANEPDATYLAVVVHHLAADEVSGRLFAENLQRLYQHHARISAMPQQHTDHGIDQAPVREALGLINWAAQLKSVVERGDLDVDMAYWQNVVADGRQALLQQQNLFARLTGDRSTAARVLPRDQTQTLLQLAAGVLRMSPQEVLLAAFVGAWQHSLGQNDCLLSLEGHGREQRTGLGDCSSTMGWFTSLYPFVIRNIDAQRIDLYRRVRDAIRALPAKGFSYLPLRYYKSADLGQQLAVKPQLSFNYLGETVQGQDGWLNAADEQAGDDHGLAVAEPFMLDVLARIKNGQFELVLRGHTPHPMPDLDALLDAWASELNTLIEYCQHVPGLASGLRRLLTLTDSLVPFASLAELDNTVAALQLRADEIEEILPLTGMQAGMWLHCTSDHNAYQDQVVLRLQQTLDEKRFAAAVHALVAETPALRTGFAQAPNGELLQIVFTTRAGHYQVLDASVGQTDDMTRLRESLRNKPRDLLRDPLFHLTLVRLGDTCYDLVIDFHHIALDGWTSALLLQRLEALYFGEASAGDNTAATGMRSYFQWLQQQAPHQARDYWRQLLGDYQGRSEVPTHRPRLPATEPRPLFVQTLAGPALNSRLVRWCEQHGVTVNAAVQALWGVFLSRLSGSDDVVFGATVSGRDIDLPGVGNIAGMLINTLPVRIRAADAASFADLVRQTAQQFAESMSYGHLTLAEIQTLSPARTALVTHALVFENYPVSDTASNRWQWQPQDIFDPMHFEFGVIVAPLAGDISFRFVADGSLFARDQLEQMGNDLCKLLLMLLDAQPATEIPVHDKPAGWSLSANFTADGLLGLLQYHEYISGHSAAVTLLPYDQSVQELINPDSRLRRLRPQQHLVLWRPVTDDSGDVLQSTAAEQLSTLAAALAACARTCTETQFYFVPCPWFRTDWHIYREFVAFAKGALAGQNNTQVLSLETLDTLYSLQQSCYPPHLVFGDIPYSDEFFAALANRLVRQRDLYNRRPIKVYVVDADDTLWGGIVGEEGVHGIRLEAVHIALQKKLLAARAAGALICLATKNNEDDVRAVFEQREMPLKWTHFTRVCAGWQPKSNSILALADDLSLGLDSFVFIDDSPLECEQVLSACPGVLAVQLPDAQHRQVFLDHLWLLDISAATREDVARARMYAEELQRAEVKKVAGSYEEFLASLDIHVDLHALQPDDLPRVAQLSQRTNQFNTTGIRYSEAQLAALLNEPDTDIRCIAVTDKYGDYGLTGSVVIRRSPTIWLVSGLMLSCRVLGRGVEHEIMRRLAQEAADSGVAELQVDFIKLPRNAPALQFLQSISVNFTETQSTDTAWQFCLPVAVAHQWQPGAMATDHDHAAPSSNHAPKAQSAENAKQTTAALSPFTLNLSDYYQCLAETLNSGANILQALHQGSTHNGTVTSHRPENKTPPVTATELTLAGFFSELLAQPEVYREDSFNALGGHSLKAVLLFSRVAIRFGVTLDFRDLQASPGLSALAARIDALASGSDSNQAEVPALTSLPPAESYPASSGQSRLWMIEQIRTAGPSPFHMHATLTVAGVINRQALENAWQTMFLRHDALRTGFYEDEHSRIRQVVAPAMTNNDLQASRWAIQWLDDVLDDAALSSRSRQLNAEPFDLGKAPLVRMAAARLTSGRHVFFITMHHMISDGWSVGVFSRELSELYSYFSDGGQSVNLEHVAAPGALQFRDFASWQLEWLASAAGVQALQFWREHFSEPVEALQLPAAAPRPALMSSEGSSVHITIDAAIRSGFTQYLNTLGISEFSGYFAVLQLVLSRLSGQTNFCIGTAVAGRQHAQLDSVIGFFVNVLPLRSTLGKSLQRQDCVDVFMQTAASEVNDCLSHQSVPFDAIVSNLALVRDPGRTPLFDVLLVLQNADTEDLKFGDQTAQVHPVTTMASQYDLTVNACPAADGSLMLLADYNRIIYSAANIELILRCMARVMSALPACGQQAVMNVPWLDDSDIRRVKTFEGQVLPDLLHQKQLPWLPDIVRQQADKAQGRLSDECHDWSYNKLINETDRVANLLSESLAGVTSAPADRTQRHIGVIGHRSVKSLSAMLAVMDIGAVYIPLDISNPVDRLALVVDEGAVELLLSTDDAGAEMTHTLLQQRAGLRHLRYNDTASASAHNHHACQSRAANDVAYMIFTSGSTGKPKGVQISHAAFAAMIAQQVPAFDVRSDDICAQFAALSFDASLSEMFLALTTGASLVIAPDSARADIDIFMAWLHNKKITVITLPPVFLRALNQRQLGKLRVLITAGEAAIAADMQHYSAGLRVINAYGPTETSVCASVYVANPCDTWPFGVPIGKPLPGVMLTVRDVTGARVPVGVTGELYIGGPTLAQGYYAAAELTAQKFTSLAGEPLSSRWYRSGDLVRWRDDGLLEFLGRGDAQIKVRGYRIEPGEIEYAARGIDGIDDALVLVHPASGLLLYCVTAIAVDLRDTLRLHVLNVLAKTLPRHMVPGDVLLLDAFPLSTSGKIDRTALLGMAGSRETEFVPPETDCEKLLAAAWQKVLMQDRVGKDDDFFALGGDSIKALEVLAVIRSHGMSCELKDFFAASRLSSMAVVLRPWHEAGQFKQALSGSVKLLPVQHWFLQSRSIQQAQHFHIVTECSLSVAVSEQVIRQALATVIKHHDALRATFYQSDGRWQQDIHADLNPDDVLYCYRCTTAPANATDQSTIEALACAPFDLGKAPLIRAVLVQNPDGKNETLVLVLHHLVADWVSLRILLSDLNVLTRSLLTADADINWQPPSHLLSVIADDRASEQLLSAADEYSRAVAIRQKFAPDCGVHKDLQTLHLRLSPEQLTLLRQGLNQQSVQQNTDFRLQDYLLVTTLGELKGMLPAGDIPLMVEGHGRDGKLDLTRQIAWLTRARLLHVDPSMFDDSGALQYANNVLKSDTGSHPDVFACMATWPEQSSRVPALISFNYLGEFASSQQANDVFVLTNKVFNKAMSPVSPVDVPLHMEFYVVDSALEIQVAWTPGVFDSETMRACWERVQQRLGCVG